MVMSHLAKEKYRITLEKFPWLAALAGLSALGSNDGASTDEGDTIENQVKNPWAIGYKVAHEQGLEGKEATRKSKEVAESIKEKMEKVYSTEPGGTPIDITKTDFGKHLKELAKKKNK
jgi:hypothetical protein